MTFNTANGFKKRFRMRVLLPGAMILLAAAVLCGAGLLAAGRGTDTMSMMAQQAEVWRMMSRGMDELALGQESVGLCERCIVEGRSPDPDRKWLDENVGFPLFDLYKAHETYILDGADQPIYASVERREISPGAFDRIAPSAKRFIELARGEAKRPSGRSNLNERLPGSPPAPMVIPNPPGLLDEPTVIFPAVRTTPRAAHATDLVRIGDRIAIISVMQMARLPGGNRSGAGDRTPVLINLRYLDQPFLTDAGHENYLPGGRLSDSPEARKGEASALLTNSDGEPLTTFFWTAQLGGSMVINSLLAPAAGVFAVIVLLIFLMSLHMRRLMKRDDEHLIELEQAHRELQAKEAQAHHLAYHDVLTGLPNRALFNDNADQAVIRARHGEPMAILLLDLDRFKTVNDRFGHLAGDELIRQVGRRLSQVLDRPKAVARLGGDEFAILLQQEDLAGMENTLDRILTDLQRPYDLLGNQAHVGVSIGVAMAPEYGCDRTDLMRKADIALYRAKEEGRNCYRFFTRSMDETVQLRAVIESDLRHALNTDSGLCVHYQSLVDSVSGQVTGLEALVRWQHPERGCIPPRLFVPVAEEAGLISELGDWVLRNVCSVAREWPDLTISINLSPLQFCDEGFAERTCELVRRAGVSAHQIEFEVTEGVMLDQNELVRGALRRLRQEGFSVALDDFGTGYSSLSSLREFEVDRIKIDKSFIQSVGQSSKAGAIVTAVVSLGHAMGLQVTAEGVETSDQEDFLRSTGCNVLQGFLFSKALPANQLRHSLADHLQARAA